MSVGGSLESAYYLYNSDALVLYRTKLHWDVRTPMRKTLEDITGSFGFKSFLSFQARVRHSKQVGLRFLP